MVPELQGTTKFTGYNQKGPDSDATNSIQRTPVYYYKALEAIRNKD